MSQLPTPVDYDVWRGGSPLVLPPDKAYKYIMCGNGLFKLAENDHLRALIPLAWADIAGLPPLSPSVHTKFGRVPGAILASILDDACQQGGDEVMYHILFKEGRIHVRRPNQVGKSASVDYAGGGDTRIICDVHSHCRMRASFSSTDDGDEEGFRFYGVFGKIHETPEIRLRIGVYGDFYPVSLSTLFTGTGPFVTKRSVT